VHEVIIIAGPGYVVVIIIIHIRAYLGAVANRKSLDLPNSVSTDLERAAPRFSLAAGTYPSSFAESHLIKPTA
jgi:hypothetical protein